ncbi:MAG: Crp/Fnr family transcriptional regulator [Mucilaginibacter sp.]|uniref:Crp/Fnr family transcriptional regulator n=1 Tax=Mucilaginibacter sp. TaxID=1882438 RepID=UPI0031A4E02C
MYEPLLKHLARFIRITESEREILISNLRYKKVDKKGYLLKQGQICSGNFFVLSGCVRMFTITANGTEQIVQFGITGWWISDYHSFENNVPSDYYIQAVEDSEIAIITRSVCDDLFQQIPQLNNYFRKMMQRAYVASLKKIELLLCTSAEDRFHQFTTDFPEFVQRIPQYMLASFLGFTPEFLSMLRAKNKSVNNS